MTSRLRILSDEDAFRVMDLVEDARSLVAKMGNFMVSAMMHQPNGKPVDPDPRKPFQEQLEIWERQVWAWWFVKGSIKDGVNGIEGINTFIYACMINAGDLNDPWLIFAQEKRLPVATLFELLRKYRYELGSYSAKDMVEKKPVPIQLIKLKIPRQ